jgi:spore coat protein H
MRSVLCSLAIQLWACFSVAAEPPALFDLTNIWTVELRITPEAWRTLRSSRAFIRADVVVNGVSYTNVAMRQKGGGTADGTARGRPPLHLNLKGRKIAGVQKLSFNNNFFDTSYLRDVLSYKLCNDFGVPAPRTAFAKLYLKSSPRESPTCLGLYTATEIVDEAWVSEHLGRKDGLLMKPRAPLFTQVRDWKVMAERAVPKTASTEAEQARMVALARFVNTASDDTFARELPSYIDVDNFLRFLVINVALANLDSYFAMAKNYYLYLNPSTGKLAWIPWDFDLSFGGHFLFGSPEQRINLSIDRASEDRLFTRLLTIRQVKQRYHALMREFLDKHFQPAAIAQQIDQLAALIEPAVMEDSRERRLRFKRSLDGRERGLPGNGWQVDVGLKQFVEGRVASLNDQLAGRSQGERPGFGMGR